MKVTAIRTGYVGLPTGVGLAELGNDVICLDVDEKKINTLKEGKLTIFEEGLEPLFNKHIANGRLKFSTSFAESIGSADLVILAVGTPPHPITKEADMRYIKAAAEELAKYLQGYTVVAIKSTVPVNTGDAVENIIRKVNPKAEYDVISLPEFLREGFAVQDFFNPDRIVVGANSERARNLIKELYLPFSDRCPILYVSRQSSETIKYASNAFLALKISYANQIANICEHVGADVEMVRLGMSADKRIGSQFLFSGLGYGGSCFPKDVKALIKTASDNNCDHSLLSATDKINKTQRQIFVQKILDKFNGNVEGKTFAVWGLAFKPKTNDMREAPSITVINALLEAGAKIQAYDPKAFDAAKTYFNQNIIYSKTAFDALDGADSLVLLTEWNEFRKPDFDKIKEKLNTPIIFDGRNQYDGKKLSSLGFEYICVGRKF